MNNTSNINGKETLAFIDALDENELKAFSNCRPKDLKHYCKQQIPWLNTEAYFLGVELGRPPTEGEVAERILTGQHTYRFRAFYALSFPSRVDPTPYEVEALCQVQIPEALAVKAG